MAPRRAARLTMHLPRGARVWQEIGGAKAITAEVEALWAMEYQQLAIAWAQGGGNGPKPKPRPTPKGNIEERADRAKRRAELERKAAAFNRRYRTEQAEAETKRRLAQWPADWRKSRPEVPARPLPLRK